MKTGEFRAAFAQFLVAVDKDPKIPDYHNNAGIALMELGRYMDAMEYFNETIGINPDLPQPYMNFGRCYSRMDKSIEAQAWFRKAMDHDKKGVMWDNYWMIGKEYMKRSEYKLAYEYLDQARNKAEKRRIRDPRLYNDIAICHYGLDQYHSAWKEICNVRYLGFEPSPDFVGKVRAVLKENGVDPDEEDRLAREHMSSIAKGDAIEEQDDAPKSRPTSIIDSVSPK
jgi:tetratricopeptide (TPR) repeat protein